MGILQEEEKNKKDLADAYRASAKEEKDLLKDWEMTIRDEPLDQLELLQEIQTAERQVDAGLGIPHEKAREQVLRSLKK